MVRNIKNCFYHWQLSPWVIKPNQIKNAGFCVIQIKSLFLPNQTDQRQIQISSSKNFVGPPRFTMLLHGPVFFRGTLSQPPPPPSYLLLSETLDSVLPSSWWITQQPCQREGHVEVTVTSFQLDVSLFIRKGSINDILITLVNNWGTDMFCCVEEKPESSALAWMDQYYYFSLWHQSDKDLPWCYHWWIYNKNCKTTLLCFLFVCSSNKPKHHERPA